MGISISPDSWLMQWSNNKKEQNLRVAEYLDEIAKEATSIAEIWDQVLTSISSNGELNSKSKEGLNRLLFRPERSKMMNALPVSRLQSFYRSASSVLGSKNKDGLEYVLFKISIILQERNLTVDLVEKELANIKEAEYFNDNNKRRNTLTIAESIEVMYKEVAELHVFAKEFKAKI